MRPHRYQGGTGGRARGVAVEALEDRCLLSAVVPNATTNAMVYDASGRLWVAYYDTANKDLRYALKNADGTWAALGGQNLIDPGTPGPNGEEPTVGQESISIVIERGGYPGVAYTDNTNADLKYAHFNGTSWDVDKVETRYTTGYYPSIAFNAANNRPAISYYYAKTGDLRLRQFNGTNWGGDADFQVVDGQDAAATDAGRYSKLALDRAGWWAIGYDDTTNGAAKYAYQRSGGVWTTRMVDNAPQDDVGFTSITFDSSNRPALAYYDSYLADLKFAKGADSTGASWNVEAPYTRNTAGKYTNMSYDAATDKFTIYYTVETASTVKINYSTGNTGSWTAQTLYTGGGSESRVLSTPGVPGGVTYSWAQVDGGTGASALYVNDTTTGTAWRQDQADAGMLGRVKHAGYAVHSVNGVSKIFAIGGDVDDGALGASGYYSLSNLVRASTDGGVTWSTWAPQGAGGTPAFTPRYWQATASFRGKLWVIGGLETGGFKGDVWSSPDGVTWTQGPDMPAAFGVRGGMASAVSADGSTLYLIGGMLPGNGAGTDVWATTDGVTWTQRTATAPFGGRGRASALYYNNKLWLLGGDLYDNVGGDSYQNDAWSSADGGVTWTQATAPATAVRFSPRAGQAAVVYDNRMWVLGGEAFQNGTVFDWNDAYYSFDGVNWTTAATGEAFQRNGAGAVVFGGRLITMFGDNDSMKNDVWSTT